MTEPTVVTDPETPEGEPQTGTYTPPATQADLDRIITERVARTKNQFKDYAELKAAKAELDQIRAQNQTEAERLTEELSKWQTEAEKWRTNAVGNRIQTLASADFADPSDATAALADPGKYLDAGGQIDEDAIKADLAAVLDQKPHWRRNSDNPGPRLPAPNPAQGSGGAAATNPADEFASILQRQLR